MAGASRLAEEGEGPTRFAVGSTRTCEDYVFGLMELLTGH